MKKRIVSLILCGLMVFSAAGCSGGGENKAGKDDVTLTMWTHINEPWNAAYKDAIKEFESENEGVRIKLETFPYDEFESKVQTALNPSSQNQNLCTGKYCRRALFLRLPFYEVLPMFSEQ